MAATFTVNHRTVTVEQNQNLLRYLRDTLRLTSVKDGCSEGACGTCTVVIDGRAVKACVQQTDRLQGKEVLTVEGLSDFEKEAFVYAFGTAGAVQCGFCIPGMVMCAKALLDRTPDPDEAQIARALRGNICRCTGYVKIIEAVRIAAAVLRAGRVPEGETSWRMGARVPRLDVREKVLGYGEYTDDIVLPGMLYGSAVRSKYPRARVLAIHTERAKALPGVACVLTADDVPCLHKVGHLKRDWDVMIGVGQITHYLGDAVALVAAETPEILAQAKALVEVEYEELTPVRSAAESMAEGAPLLHEDGNLLAHRHVRRGDADAAIRSAPHVLSAHFTTPFTEHAFLEPECAVAQPCDDGGVLIWCSDQSVYDTQHEICPMLGPAAGAGARGEQACRRRLRRQGGRDGAAPRGADRLPAAPPGQGEAHAGREHPDPSQAPPDGHGLHPRLRRAGQHPRRQGAGRGRYGRVRLARRAGARARVHARGRAVPL